MASRDSAAAATSDAIVQVYGARCAGWRAWFAVHTWIALKPSGAPAYTVYEISDSHYWRSGSAVVIRKRKPDARWYGHTPTLLAERRGPGVDALIERIETIARGYAYNARYVVWPGPNSNSFTAHVTRAVPELGAALPPTAIGKDYLGARLIAKAPSGRGFQVSLFGLLGIVASRVDGLELNVLGLTFGIDPFCPALKLPLLGRIGLSRARPAGTPTSATEPAAAAAALRAGEVQTHR